MISQIYDERLQHLGHRGDWRDYPLPAKPVFVEPSARERLANPKAFIGNHCGFEVLPPLGLTFESIRSHCLRLQLPALDVGASLSTVAAEAALRGITIHSTELPPIRNREHFNKSIRLGLVQLGECYNDASKFPPGFEYDDCPNKSWEHHVDEAVSKVSETLIECSANHILGLNKARAPNKSYSVVFSHHGVPKYCSTENFLDRELPELLRVTAGRLHLYPFRSAGPDNELLHVPGSDTYRKVAEIAVAAGFTFTTFPAKHLVVRPHTPPPEPGFDTTAVFVRRSYGR